MNYRYGDGRGIRTNRELETIVLEQTKDNNKTAINKKLNSKGEETQHHTRAHTHKLPC